MTRVIGNEIFKTIVEMAYEMKTASRVLTRIDKGWEQVREAMKAGQRFRDDEDIRKEITKHLAISHKNKKHWRFDEEEEMQSGFVLKRDIPISVSGEYRIMVRVVKHAEYEVAGNGITHIHLYVRCEDYNDDAWNDYLDPCVVRRPAEGPLTSTSVALLKRAGLELECDKLIELYNDIYPTFRSISKHALIWKKRIMALKMKYQEQGRLKEMRQRYGHRIDRLMISH
jgi:hypothetical protein